MKDADKQLDVRHKRFLGLSQIEKGTNGPQELLVLYVLGLHQEDPYSGVYGLR